ncbi:MAG TPA: GH25 family lysozyme [Longimicrobium sp.]|jgi:lysozyme|uniref:glycoside hydrolase family 25 protein n=1 Tax=Longimicrobium sp. TaxID=2029185 RepID=UPI002ED9ADCD
MKITAFARAAAVVGALLLGACDTVPTGTSPFTDQVEGIDVSHWQGTIDWNAVAADRVDFAFIKATEGGDYTDPRFAANWTASARAGIPRGAYHFYRPQTDAAVQADLFLRVVQPQAGDLPPVLDVEVTDGRSAQAIAAGVRTWMQRVEQATGRRPILYVRAGFWNQNVGAAMPEYPLWVAHYDVVEPAIPAGWSRWTFWQYSQTGRVAGITGDVDLNHFAGTRQELRGL